MTASSSTKPRKRPPPIVFLLLGLLLFVATPQLWKRASGWLAPANAPTAIQQRMSVGERILLQPATTPEKTAGAAALVKGDRQMAITQFEASLSAVRNDPETVIYLNNARITKPALKIAVSVPISSNPNVAQELLRGVAQAQTAVNQSGNQSSINGQPLEVQIIDDANDASIAAAAAQALVNDPQVLAVVGHNASNATQAAAPIYQQGQLVMISPTSSANQLSGLGDYIFRTIPTNRVMAGSLADYMLRRAGKTKLAICYDSQSLDNVSFKDELITAFTAQGGQVMPLTCDLFSPSFNPLTAMKQIRQSGADAILLAPFIDRIERATDLAQANQRELALFSSPTLYTSKTLQSGQQNVKGLVLPVVWYPATSQFSETARQLWGGTVNWRTATAYDAAEAIIAGLRQGASRKSLQAALRNPTFSTSGAGDSVRFLPTGDREIQPILVQVQPDSTQGYAFVPLPR